MRSVALWILVVLAVFASADTAGARTVDGPGGASFERSVLSRDHTTLKLVGNARRVSMTAHGTGPDWNRREVFALGGAPSTRRQTTCATWSKQSGTMLQQGLAARIRDSRGRVRAVTLTKNTIFDVNWIFNILTWDTDRNGDIWRTVGQYNLASALVDPDGRLRPLPWRACLRTVGRTVSFKVWPTRTTSEPTWNDPTYARDGRLPRRFAAPGRAGWYVGHIPDDGRLVYRRLTTW